MCCARVEECITSAAYDVRAFVRQTMIDRPDITEVDTVAAIKLHKERLWRIEFAGFIQDGHTSHLLSVNDWQGPEIEARESFQYFKKFPNEIHEDS